MQTISFNNSFLFLGQIDSNITNSDSINNYLCIRGQIVNLISSLLSANMPKQYSVEDQEVQQYDLIKFTLERRRIWRFVIRCLTCFLPSSFVKKRARSVEGYRSKVSLMIIFIITNLAFILATQIGNKADFVARLFLCFPVLGLVIRFILSLFNKRTMPNKIPDDLGGLALMLPCYTEGEESLKPTIDSMVENVNNLPDSLMRCLFVVCDGRVQGKENDKMTCEIMKDILSPYDKVTEGVKYTSAWTGANTCDVASGWYEGLPYIQITKHENRGKRDSQLIMLTLLRWQSDPIIDVIKDHLRYLGLLEHGQQFPFQFLFATDSDTIIKPDSLDILMQGLTKKRNTVAVCGNVKILNKHKNLLTMSQVYEYFFSQFHTRGAESKIGRVTCLPGCFTLYKLYHKVTADMIHPYAIQDDVFFSYACQPSTTLHHMNLMLGEVRIQLKHSHSPLRGDMRY